MIQICAVIFLRISSSCTASTVEVPAGIAFFFKLMCETTLRVVLHFSCKILKLGDCDRRQSRER